MLGDVTSIYPHRVPTLLGPTVSLEEFRGRVLLIVNTASGCGFVGQMKGLQRMHRRFADAGFCVLAFPSNDFNQEPLRDAALTKHACETWGADFPIFDVTHVRGPERHPIFATLTAAKRPWLGRNVLWNYEKFLVGRDGRLLGRWRTPVKPDGFLITHAVTAAVARA